MTKVDDLEGYIRNGKMYLSTYSIRKLLSEVEELGFTKYACEEVLKRFRSQAVTQTDQTPKQNIINKSENQHSKVIPPTNFIDDPNELLMSCAVRELNKPRPDVQWGRILLTILEKTNRLETKTEQEVMIRKKLVKYSSNQLIELRKRLISS